MNNSQLSQLTLVEAIKGIKKKYFNAKELALGCIETINTTDKEIGAFLTINKEIIEQAEKTDKNKSNKIIAGIPFAVKDVLSTKNIETTAGSKILKGYRPPLNATIVQKLLNENGIILGKTNCDAFAFGASGENSGFFPTRNPHNLNYVPGGSSSGSAAAVAANQTIFALGTDTGGSIRQPAAFCGVVGLKPTYGRCSRWGLISMASSFDCPGPITKTVEDAAIVMNIIAGKDNCDATSINKPVPNYLTNLKKGVKNLRVGIVKEFINSKIQPEILKAVENAAKIFEKQGAKIETVSLPHNDYAISAYYVLVPAEISSNMARYDGIRFGPSSSKGKTALEKIAFTRGKFLEPEVKRRIMIGSYTLSAGYFDAYYLKASKIRTLIMEDFAHCFSKVDVLLGPVTPTTAFKLGEKLTDPVQMYLSDIFTVSANVAGIPAISIPFGKDKKNLPVGIQILGKHLDEATILQTAYLLEQFTKSQNV